MGRSRSSPARPAARAAATTWSGPWPGCSIALPDYEIVDGGEVVCTRSSLRLVSKATGRALETGLIELYRFADGRIVDVDVY